MRAALLLLLLASGPCFAQAPAATPSCPFAGQTPKLVVQLFFGQSVGDRGLVSLRSWQRFVADTVTPALPSGFTVIDAYGQWMDQATHAIGREPTKMIVVAEDDTPDFRARVAKLADEYRRRFAQKSVGIVANTACGVF